MKFLLLMLCGIMALSLAACSSPDSLGGDAAAAVMTRNSNGIPTNKTYCEKAITIATRPGEIAVLALMSVGYDFSNVSGGNLQYLLSATYLVSPDAASQARALEIAAHGPYRVVVGTILQGTGSNRVVSAIRPTFRLLPSLLADFVARSPETVIAEMQNEQTRAAYELISSISQPTGSIDVWQSHLANDQMLSIFRDMLAEASGSTPGQSTAAASGGHGYLGITFSDSPWGAYIVDVNPNSPVGGLLRPGYVIQGVDGHPIAGMKDLTDAIAHHAPGDSVILTWRANGMSADAPVSSTVILASKPGSP